MAVTIFEALQNANHNLENSRMVPQILDIAKNQLNNAVVLLEKGYGIDTLVEPLLEKHGKVEDVPDAEEI